MTQIPTPSSQLLKRTPLHGVHVALGAKMVPFAGFEMPVTYPSGINSEHRAVREDVGVFDVSHMGEFEITGSDRNAFVQRVTCNDVGALKPGQAQYSGILTKEGTFVDDCLVYRFEDKLMMVVNASNIQKDWEHIVAQKAGAEIVLPVAGGAHPSGYVEKRAYEDMADAIVGMTMSRGLLDGSLFLQGPGAADLSAELGSRATLLSEDSGGRSFDETFSTPWTKLAHAFPDKPIPAACLSATVEYRGSAEVGDEWAEPDAQALFRFLQRRGLLAGDPGPLPAPQCEATRLDACDVVRSPAAGVVQIAESAGPVPGPAPGASRNEHSGA